ncbi:DUF2818 family protein [Spiribacter aquaticus]|jgi:TRAP-type C4-dicarboxylate transport system permease small subunit|uniref:DUF2818 family protein n=2 Tax=Spiribacter TaxID=1335745 RepID=A0A557RK10_9GAMM|nr:MULTISPECIES: DUF2818 family protein [Spiribacter]AUB78069.1 hypothetical protein BBH56_02400 [Spiribacter roseus]KAF0280036.1 hypothetical protein BA897_04760 [Spiribacter roseus]KAF0282238.1 hypothetical protein BA900_07525 [Spiribacter roseus]KAF0286174.1 hypothetical protein BA899_06460 [Spiribacter sp. SSL99]TVO65436.1 DUF2818 family protein [Spiribacter aquaticus]
MATQTAIIALLVVAIIAANLPWMSERVAFVGTPPARGKSEWIRLVEWLLLFCLVGLIAAGLEYRTQGQLQAQGWEFWVMNLSLFAVFALPGFIYHHDLRRRLQRRGRRRES